jgi:glycosyltransferase involved in cell wall biosynthesis
MRDLSIIIPLYNTPIDCLQRCFQSILPLKQVDYEVLLIDDGSAAEVGDYCKAFAKEHPAFQYHYKDNGGVSSARNLGLSLAAGRYTTFVDADDMIYAAVLEKHLSTGNMQQLVLFDILLTERGSDSVWYAFDLPQGPVTREQVLNQLITASSISGPVAKLYQTKRIREASLAFNTQFISGEDWMFVCDYVMQADSFFYYREPVYRYFRDEATGLNRTMRFPDTMLQNQLKRYARKQEILSGCDWQQFDPVRSTSLAAAELIENLFNSAADLLLAKQYTKERKSLIRSAVTAAGKLLAPDAPSKTKLKLLVLTRCPVALWPLAQLRAVYLKHKK